MLSFLAYRRAVQNCLKENFFLISIHESKHLQLKNFNENLGLRKDDLKTQQYLSNQNNRSERITGLIKVADLLLTLI